MQKSNVATGRPRLELIEKPELISGRLPLAMRLAARYGIGHAKRVLVRNGSSIKVEAAEEGFMRLVGEYPGVAHMKALNTAYYLGAVLFAKRLSHVMKEASLMRGLWGAMMQRELTSLILRLTPAANIRIRDAWKEMDVDRGDWMQRLGGALATARLAYAFLRLRANVYQPLLDEDTRGKIDLMIELPGITHGVCLQVKGDGLSAETTLLILTKHRSSDERYFLGGVTRFICYTEGDWRAAVAHVGLQGLSETKIHECHALRAAVGEFVSNNFPDYSPVRAARAG